jgi:hypothetical protein
MTNPSSRGFPVAVNEGLLPAHGDYFAAPRTAALELATGYYVF